MALLLISSLVIATASAATFATLTMESQITISALVHFSDGDDTTSTSTVHDSYCSLSLSCYPNATTTYEQAVNVTNSDTAARQIRLRHVSISGNGTALVSNFTSITFHLLDSSGTEQGSITYTASGNYWQVSPTETSYVSIPAGTDWTIKVVIVTSSDAQTSVSCDIEIALDVQ